MILERLGALDADRNRHNENMEKMAPQKTGEICPECGSEVVYRNGKFGRFISCSNYPTCKYTKNETQEDNKTEDVCPNCGNPLVIKRSRYGERKEGGRAHC